MRKQNVWNWLIAIYTISYAAVGKKWGSYQMYAEMEQSIKHIPKWKQSTKLFLNNT